MNDKIAIDIALLPPDEIMDLAIKINRAHKPEFLLNKQDYLPHITLSQAILKQDDLAEAEARLKLLASEFKPLLLKAKIIPNFIEPYENKGLIKLHKVVMGKFQDLVSYNVQAKYFFDSHIRHKSLNWVRNYRSDSAFGSYYPHLTLGTTEPIQNVPDVRFTVKRLVVCHLGNYNTCRKILVETELCDD